MARALSEDSRLHVLKAADEGAPACQAAARFGVGVSSAIRWIARANIGELTPRPQGRRRGSRLDGYAQFSVGMIEDRKDIALNGMVGHLEAERSERSERSERIGRSALSDRLGRHGWTTSVRQGSSLVLCASATTQSINTLVSGELSRPFGVTM